jgi:hypothetical protein
MRLTLWLFDLEELGNVDWLGISSGDHDRKVWAGNTTVVSLGTIDWRLDLDTDIERFCNQFLLLSIPWRDSRPAMKST